MRLHFKLLSKTGKPGLDDSGGDCWGGVGPTVVARGNHCHYCRESGDGESTLFNAFGSDRDGRGRDPKREAGREPHLVQKDSAVQGKCADRKIEQGQGGSGSREFVLPDASHEDWISPQEEKGCITRVACRGRTVEGPGISGSGREYDQFSRSDDHSPVVYIIDGSLEVVGVNASGVVQFGGGVAGDFDTDGYAKIVRELNAALGGMSAFDGNVRDIECDLIQCYGHFRHAKMDAFKCSEVGGREWKCIPYACQGNVIGGSIGVGCCAEDKEHQHVLRSLAFDGKRLANIGQDEGTFFFRGAIKPGSDNDDIWILREAKAFIEGGLYRFRHLVNRCSKPFGGDVALDDEEPRYQNLKHTQGSIFVKNRVNKYPHISSSGGNQHQGKTVQPLRSLNYSRRKVKCRGSLYLRFAMVVFASVPLAPNLSEAAGILRSHNQGQPDSDSGGGDGYMRKLRKKATKVPEETSSLENAHLENHQPIHDFDKDVHGLSTYIAAASTDMIDFHSENITTEEMSVAPVVRGLSGDNTLGQIRTYDEKCVDVTDHSFGRVEACSEAYEYQLFYFDLSTLQIKQDGKCLDSTPGNLVATIHDCIDERRSQKWYYNIYTKQLRSLDIDHCLTGVINNNLRSLFCKEKENRRFDIPSQWSIGFVSDVPFPGRIHHNIHDSGSLCFERLYDTMYLGTCNGDFTSQDITYNPSTFELEVLGKCLHYDDTREYLQVSGCSNYGERQKWYYNEYTLQLMNFYSNKCITAKVLSDPGGIVRWILSVEDCIDYNIRQQFYLPLHWSIGDPSHWPDKVKEENRQAIRKYFTDKEVCIQSVTEENEPRVRMITHCDERNKYQKFVYDQSEQAIKQSGMCLHFDDSLSIAALRKCNGSDNQSWYYDINSGSFYIIYSGSRWCLTCLHEDLSFRTCDDADDQIFIVPQSWHMESNSTYAGDRIQMYYNMDECIETISKQYHTRVSVSSCNDTAKTYQQFFYAKYLRAIKQSGLCLTVDDANINIAALDFCSHNSINQAWYYNVYTHELNSFLSSKCLSLNEESNHTMRECDGSEDQKFIVPSNWHIDLVPFVQIQNWRVAATQDDEISRNRLSFSSNNSTTAAFFLSDGSSANDHEMHHGYSGWEHNGGTGLKLNGSVEFGDHTVQIDSHWRIRQTDMDHLSISHENGNVPRIYISDGTFSSGDPSYSGYIEDLGVEQCAFVTDKYLQIGDWRLGAVYSDSLSVTHSTGVTTGIYHMDGTYQVLRSEEKEQVRYSAWSLRSSNVIRGSPNGCRSVILMNTAPGGMKCLQVSSIDNTTSFVTCDTSKHNQQFFLRHRSPDKFILQPSQIMDHCISTNSNLEVNDCQWLDGAPLWTINKANGRIVPNGNQDYCITHDFNNDRDAKVNLCNDNYQTHVSIAPFRSLPPSVKEYSVLAPGLSSVFPHNGIQLFGREEYSNFTISGWNIPLMADTTLAFKFRIDTPADEGNFEVCVAFNFANPNPATTLPDFPFCINLLNSVHSYNIQIENDYVIRLADFMANDEDYDYMKYDVANNPGAEELVVDLVIFRQRETATDTEARSRFHSIDLYNPGTGTLVKRGSTELKMKINYPPGSNTKGLHFIPRVLIQNAYGDYDTVVSEAQKFGSPIDEAGSDFFTIKNLPPGRRFQIELDPVDQSGNAFSDDRRQLKILFEAYTSCSIQPIPPSGDHSGKPRSFKIFQSESKDDAGLISFQFTHNSECSEAYALTRQETDKGNGVNETVTFTPTYFFESTNSASGTSDVISPEGMDFKDRVAFLQVGKTYEYCVAAVAKNYMVNPELSSGALVQSSKRLCNHHTVQWEASAIVKVTLKRESGSEPVQNVTVTWKLLSPDGTEGLSVGTTVTPKNGLVHIKLKIDPVTPIGINLNQGDQLPLKIEFAKTSDGMSHTFLCNEETSICSENGHIIYLSHLDFEELVHITDATTMLVSGTVYSGYKVESNDMQHTGCTLGGVEVCLKKKGAVGSDGTIQCVKTDSFGYYELFATIGTYIYPDVEWVGHKFVPLNFETGKKDFMKENLYQEGIFVSPENVAQLSKHDFFDETTARLKVEVAGGECDIFLGKSKVQVTQENCDSSIFSQTFEQEEIRKEYEVPAHVLYVEVISLQDSLDGDREFVMNEFRDFSIRIDLTETGEESELEFVENIQALSRTPTVSPSPFISTSPSPFPNPSISRDASELTENGNDKNLARFQYNGILVIKPAAIEQDRSGDCYYYKTERAGESESFHVVKTTNDFDVKVLVYQMIIPPNEDIAGHFCSIVESSTKLTIHNDVGIAPDNDILASSTKGEKERYTKCAGENPCITLVELLSESEGSPSFGVKLQLKAGLPKKEKSDSSVEPYHSKKLTITSGSSRHIMYVVITGDFPATGNDYFSVPVTKPLLVIRDPPGGLSSVAYKNVQTSIKISHNHYERYSGYDNGFESRLVVKSGASMAVPFCVGPESDLLEGDLETGIGVNLHGSTLEDFDDDTRSRSLVVEWSYSTAGENGRGLAGKDSDVFLIPTFNILFAETDVIMFDDSICEAYSSRQTKFDLTNDGNKEAISFLTYHQISTVTLPELQRQLTQVDDEVRRLSIQNSINAWNVALAEYEDTNQKAEEGELARTSGIDQFTNVINSTLDNQQARTSINPDESPTSILPKVFAENLSKNALNLSNSIIEQTTPDKIIRADHVHFSGGGNVVAMEFDDEDIVNHMSKFNGLHGNSDTSESFGVDADSSLAVGFSALFGFHVSARTYSTDDVSWRYFNENNQRKKTSIRVEFGDSDDGDEFLVGIYLDPAYGTFVFSTAAGQSKCPHEKNTLPIEDPFIAVSKMPPNIVGSDNLMVFELELGNKGYGDSTFLLYHETSDNTDGLRLDFMESSTKTWILPSTYLGGTVTKTTMTIAKGPKHSIYNPIHVYLASKCDFNGEYGNSRVSVPLYNYAVQGEAETKKYIKFTEICPAVEWANIKQFSINSSSDKSLSMTILNPSERKLSEEEFLESISLQYRKVNDPPRPWETGRGVDGAELNLKIANEDFFGYITSNWKYPRIEGFYEVRLKSSCDCDACPLHLSEFTSDSIFGTIDLTPPRVYGEPIPHGNIAPGEQLTVYFTEAIDCGQPYGFNVWIQLSESSILYDKNDLDFTCEGNSIGIVFNEDRIVGKSFDRLLGRSFTMRIAGIKDRSGNEMEEDFTFESNFVCLPPEPKIVISFDETRQYLPHEPIMFKATISNHKERWVTTTKLFVPTNARKARKKSFSPRAVDVNEETTSEEMSVEGMTFITDAPSLAPTSSSIPSLLPTELLVPSILSSSLPSKSNLLTFTPSLSSVPSINPSKVSTDKPTFAPFVPYGSTQSNGRTVLIPQDTEVGERYGCSVDLSGGTSIVGSAESAIIYRWNEGEEIWKQEAKLTIPGEESFDGFGTSVGISGDFVIIGAPNHGQSGAAFIYFWDIEDSSWKFEKKLTPLDLQEHGGFGTSVGISGNYVVVGSPYNLTNSDNSLSGTAYTYFCDSSGSWGYEQKLPVGNETVHHTFGSSVGIDGDVIAVGSPHGDNSLHVYRVKLVSGIPIWYHEAKIVSRNIDFEFEFGSTVAVSRNVIVASSPQNESQRSHHGIVYVYRWSLSNNWELDTTLTPIDSESVAKFGCSLDISNDVLLVGSCGRDEQPGSAQVFLYQPEIRSWSKQLELTARDVIDDVRELNHSFGFAVAVSEFTAIVGSPGSRFSSIFAFDNYTTVVETRDGSSATTSYLELGLNLKTNHNGLQVLVNGEPLISNQVYTLDGDDDTNTTIALLKGPGNQLSFPPISLFLRSHCSRDSHKPVKVTADLWNWEDPETGEKIIRFTPPCPSIHWASQSKMLSGLIEGNTTLNAENSFMKVSIFNEGFMERKLFDRSIANAAATVDETPLQDVVLLYRRDGDMSSAGWIQGKLYLDRNRSSASSEDSVLVDFSTENVEDDFGYVSLFWDLSALPDGIYETKVVARCNQTSSSIATQSSSTKTVKVIVDRLPPKIYGYPDLHMPIHKHPASTEYSIDFTEEVACEWPFTFDLSLIINDGENITHVRSNDGIHIICSGRSIRYRFDRSRFNFGSLQYLLSSSITVLLKNVEDLAGNMMATEFRGKMTNDKNMAQLNREERIELSPQGQAVFGNQADFTFGTGDHVYLDDLATDCPLKIDLKTLANGLGCDGIDQNCDGVVDDCEEDIKPPTIYLLEGIEREKLPEFDGMVYLPGKCFESTFQVMSYLEKNVYAKDECASEFVYNISQVSFHDFFNKNHNYRLVEYSITAFDARCGNGPAWSAQESFLVKIFQGFDDDMKFQGCNGVDENCDGVVDDCMEDRISPLILIEDSIPPSAYSYDGNLTFIESLSFNSIQTGMEFLLKAIKAEDDCAKGLDISTSVNEVSCSNTIVTVTASDPRCSESNPIQLVTREFVLRVDNTAPMVDLGFDHDIDPEFFDPDGKVLHIRESKKSDYENIHFWYNITDDCPQSVDVEIVVSSNEFQYTVRNGIEMALIQTRKGMDRTHQQNVLVEPKMCNQIFGQTIRGCETDPNSLVRYYEISVKATDYGGNVGESIVKVIVIPRQYVRMFFNNSGKNAADAHPMFFVDLISQSTSSNVIATKEFKYEIP